MFADVAFRQTIVRNSIEVLQEIMSLYDSLGLIVPAVHVATALEAARSVLDESYTAAFTVGSEA